MPPELTPAPPVTPPVTPPATPPVVTPPPAPVASALAPPATPPAPITLVAPEGSKLQPAAVERTAALVARLGLSGDHAQEFLGTVSSEVAAHEARLIADAEQVRRVDWVQQTQNDPEIGGAKFLATTQAAARARQEFFSPEFNTMLDQTGLGNHPEFVRAWAKVGHRMADGKLVSAPSSEHAPNRKSTAEVMYGNSGASAT